MDVALTEQGISEAKLAGKLLLDAGVFPTKVHSSLLRRALMTMHEALSEMDRLWLPVQKHWRLNERHYGALQGLNKKETTAQHGEAQVHLWRRSFDTPPPPLGADDERHPAHDPRYQKLAPDLLPATECLKDVVSRMLPYWYDAIVPDLLNSETVLVVAHGNSLRALVMHLEGISEGEISDLNIPTGIPRVYELDDQLQPIKVSYLGDEEAARAAAEAVANQAR